MCIFGSPQLLIVNKDSIFTGDIIQFILQATNHQMKIISPFNPVGMRTGWQIQAIGQMVTKHLTGKGKFDHCMEVLQRIQ